MNPSVSGNTTRQALERMAYDVQAHEPDVLVIQFGMNDCNEWQTDRGLPRVSLPAFRANLAEMVERARRFGARSVFLDTNHPSTKSDAYAAANRRYNAAIRLVAEETGATLVDMERAADGKNIAELLMPDGVHLARAGHDLYFQTMYPRIDAVL
jgi:lysophospholipase L1-like esterase